MATSCSTGAKAPERVSPAQDPGLKKVSQEPDQSGQETLPFVGDYKVHRYRFPNGLRLLVVEDHSSPTLAYQTWFRVGSRDEVPGYTGLAHLFEHMMFKETKNLKDGEFDKILESSGAEGENAFTWRDYTGYIQEMPKDKLELIARMESDRMVNLLVNDNSFKTEREVVQNERRYRTENSPDGTMYQELFGMAFKSHPYHWPVIGYQEDLERMTAEDARKFYQMYYSPNHATIVVVGDVDAEATRQLVNKYYGGFKSQDSPARVINPEPAQTASQQKTMKFNIQVEKLIVGYHMPASTDPDMPAMAVTQALLTAGRSSRLNRALVETSIASGVDSYDFQDKDPSLFAIAVNLQKGKKATLAETVIRREIERLGKESIPAKELERAKNQMKFSLLDGLDANGEKAHFLGFYETIADGFEHGVELVKKAQAVTPDQIQAVVKKYLNPNNRTVVVGVPK